MALEIVRYRAAEVPVEIRPKLKSLTLREGQMWHCYTDILHGTKYDINGAYRIGIVYIAYLDDTIVGWTLRYKYSDSIRWSSHIFVHKSVRLQGIGSKLLKRSTKYLKHEVNVTAWDKLSTSFWETELMVKEQKIQIEYLY